MPLSRRFRHRRDDWVVHGQLHAMNTITCPVCGSTAEPAAQVGAILICANPTCGASLVQESGLEGDTVRRATAADTTVLTSAELQALRSARRRTR